MASTRKVTLSMRDRLKVLDDLQTFSISTIAKKYNVHRSTVTRIKNNAPEILKFADKGKMQQKRQRIKPPMYDGLEQHLLAWFIERRTLGDFISDAILMQKAIEIKHTIGLPSDFKVSKGWLDGFKKRNDIRLAKVYGEAASADSHAAEKFCSDFENILKASGIDDIVEENLYNMDETGLLWKTLPSKTLALRKEYFIKGFKSRKERITVALCANASGTHKLKPLVINKYENPRVLKNCKQNLPVIFKSQKNAWMTQNVFVDWYENYFKPSVRAHQLNQGISGKVALILDNCGGHRLPEQLADEPNFKIIFLPPNTTSLIQPMDRGVIAKFKSLYRHKTVQKAVTYEGGINEFQKEFNLKDCIQNLHTSWMEVSADNIINSWNKIIPETRTYQRDITILTGTTFTAEDVSNFIANCDAEENRLLLDEREEQRSGHSRENSDLTLEAQHIFQRLDQLVSNDAPVIKNIVNALKNHILGADE